MNRRLLVFVPTALFAVLAGAALAAKPPGAPPKSAGAEASWAPAATVSVPGKAHDIALSGDRAYVATSQGLTILDIAEQGAPKVLGSAAFGGPNFGVEVKGDRAYLARADRKDGGLVVVDVSTPAAPKPVATIKAGGKPYDVAIKDNVAYALENGGTLYLFDLSNPDAPKEIRQVGMRTWRPPGYHKGASAEREAQNLRDLAAGTAKGVGLQTGLLVEGNRLFACDWAYGRVFYYDVTDAANPVFRGTHFSPYVLRMAARGDDLYMISACGPGSGLYHARISEMAPTKSTQTVETSKTGVLHCAGPGIDMGGIGISEDGRLVVWGGGKGAGEFHATDVSDPAHMKDVASTKIGAHRCGTMEVMGAAVCGKTAYLCAGVLGVQVYRLPGSAGEAPPNKELEPPARQDPIGDSP